MALRYKIDDNLTEITSDEACAPDVNYVEVMGDDEFERLGDQIPQVARDQIADLLTAESCYVNIYPDYIIGSIAAPDKNDLMGDRDLFSFYWTPNRLLFIDESNRAEEVLRRVARVDLTKDTSTAGCMREFLRELVLADPTWLGGLEDKMEDAEEAILDDKRETPHEDINAYRRITIRMTTYYQQLSEMALAISANDNNMMTPEQAQPFESIVAFCDRLVSRAETIREYSLQLRELRQTQIDMEQNKTMQLLTIVTVILAPLTLIAGWFGMNFTNIPGVNEPWGFPVICIIGVTLTLVLIIWFKKKKWL